MADRKVTKSRKDNDGDITALCNDGQWWSPRTKADAINDIESNTHSYYVQQPATSRSDIQVVNDRVKGKYLRTGPDGEPDNNLDNLPDC
ncbi:MAG: DUF3892 domain-containing protein [Rhodospirillales bacterium]|nr:DUF3892 domain-containing protein [Rhodospirillales bacterium]